MGVVGEDTAAEVAEAAEDTAAGLLQGVGRRVTSLRFRRTTLARCRRLHKSGGKSMTLQSPETA